MDLRSINLAFRFILEVASLVSFGWWGATRTYGIAGVVLAIIIPLLSALVWSVFAVPDDPSRSGKAPVRTPGAVRLVLELGFFGAATASWFAIGLTSAGWAMGIGTVVHYAASYDRIRWLLDR